MIEVAEQVQDATSACVAVAFVDQRYTDMQAAQNAAAQGIRLKVVKSPALSSYSPATYGIHCQLGPCCAT